ncbi:4204_t:CDS:2 [Funneliformis caledonium]|uniref:4204_t:CDS:1 n=1 Tax=Funneliformis caledonium TaxID=1117310 RepID=A0A9N8YQN1_9GLOM|nr:4204_t:CDS:2 [Funneliformis caledonium]
MENTKWLEQAIKEGHINFHAYEKFSDVVVIGRGAFGEVYKAAWDNRGMIVALKSLLSDLEENVNPQLLNELIKELKLHRKVDYHPNIVRFYGVSQSITAHGIACLHEENIIHRDLHSSNILVNKGEIKISDFGLSKHLGEMSSAISDVKGDIAYIEPQCLSNPEHKRNVKSDIYSVGVLLWEISSGRSPFRSLTQTPLAQLELANRISKGKRESPVAGTPKAFIKIYTQCWDNDPNNRPNIHKVLEDLNDIHLDGSKPKVISSNNTKGTENNSRSNISKSINRRSVSSFTEISSDLSNAINDIDETYHNGHSDGITGSCSADTGLSSEMMNAINQIDKVYYNNRSDNASEARSIKSLNINSSASSNSQNVSSSLKSPRLPKSRRSSLNSPPSSPTSLTHGRIQNTDKTFLEELLKFFEELLELSPDTTTMISKLKGYLHNRMREHKSTFKLLLKYHNDVRFACLIGYCLECAIGTAQDKHEGFKYYQKSADSNNSNGQYFLGRCYYFGYGVKQDRTKAFQLLKTSSDNGNSRGQWMLGFCYERGYGTVKDPTQAFNQYLASAEAGNVTSQMELGRCYEEGIGTKKNIQLASECYEKSYKGGFTLAKKRWDHILKIQRRLQLSKNSPNITQALRHRGDLEKSRANTMELPDRVPSQSFSTLRMFKVACFMTMTIPQVAINPNS